jgi:hypothetical protein
MVMQKPIQDGRGACLIRVAVSRVGVDVLIDPFVITDAHWVRGDEDIAPYEDGERAISRGFFAGSE